MAYDFRMAFACFGIIKEVARYALKFLLRRSKSSDSINSTITPEDPSADEARARRSLAPSVESQMVQAHTYAIPVIEENDGNEM